MFCSRCGRQLDAGTLYCTGCGAPLGGQDQTSPPPLAYSAPPPVYSAPPPAAQQYAPALPYASWGDRALGYIIDSLFVFGVLIILWIVMGSFVLGLVGFHSVTSFNPSQGMAQGVCCTGLILLPLSSLLVGLYNRMYLVSVRGCSIGQGVMKLKVVDAQGRLLSMGAALGRLLAHVAFGFIPFLSLLDLLWPLWDAYRQTLHDKVVGCYVIYNPDVAR